MKIDPTRTWRKVEERLQTEKDPILRRNLETILAHMKAEAVGDVDALMATLAERAHYHAYGAAPEYSPFGRREVRKFYEAFIASGASKLELDVDRLVVDRDCVLTEGVMRMAYPGSLCQALGHEVDDPEAYYLFETRMAILWPMDEEGKLLGEDTYSERDGFEGIANRKLAPEEIGTAGS
ncbi:MAG: nuclear transport factor 2 family protein [Candidatus Binatia bacterium]